MPPAATVLVPTHDHGRLLRPAVESALGQTVQDIEIFVVGDGTTPETDGVARDLARVDDRIRYFPNQKGPRLGEVHRHSALRAATGHIVCYLSDDDLWLPDHVEYLQALLVDADFAHSLPLQVEHDGTMRVFPGSFQVAGWRDWIINIENFVPLSAAGHTMDLYRRLPRGWTTSPRYMPTDLYMWRQILAVPGCRAVSGYRPTYVHLPSASRAGASSEERLDELEDWAARIRSSEGRAAFREQARAAVAEQLAAASLELRSIRGRGNAAEGERLQVEALRALLEKMQQELESEGERAADMAERAALLQGRLEKAARVIRRMEGSLTWRARNRLLSIGPIRRLARMVGAARSRRAAR